MPASSSGLSPSRWRISAIASGKPPDGTASTPFWSSNSFEHFPEASIRYARLLVVPQSTAMKPSAQRMLFPSIAENLGGATWLQGFLFLRRGYRCARRNRTGSEENGRRLNDRQLHVRDRDRK